MEAAAAADRHVHFTDNFIIADTAAALVGFNSQLGPVSQSQGSGDAWLVWCIRTRSHVLVIKMKCEDDSEADS